MEFLINLDGNILLWIQEYIRQDWMEGFWKGITMLGDSGWFWIALSLLLMVPRQTRWIGITSLAAIVIGALITNVTLKNLVARTRPYEVVEGLRMLPKKFGIPLVILAAMIAFSRLYVGVHYPTDVLAGLLIGLFAAWAARHMQKYVRSHRKKAE